MYAPIIEIVCAIADGKDQPNHQPSQYPKNPFPFHFISLRLGLRCKVKGSRFSAKGGSASGRKIQDLKFLL
jgi:hypothetical protein